MHTQIFHDLLPKPSHDELARQNFVKSFKLHLATRIAPGNRTIYERRVKSQFEARNGRPPKDGREVGRLLSREPYYRLWSSLARTGQELMWDSIIDTVERQQEALNAKVRPRGKALGSLTLDPSFVPPRYVTAVDIHCQPGGYCTETAANDAAGGALFDRHGDIYGMGNWGPMCDAKGQRIVAVLRERFLELAPKRVLEMGCSIGHSLPPYADAYPEAEVHGIDVGAPLLRYGHARAELLGKAIHFSQQNAERTNFPDGYFDLIVSHVLLHETSGKAVRNIMRECHRLLAPRGVMAHSELQMYRQMEPYDAFMLDWDTFNNNEPFWSGLRALDPEALMAAAGFSRDAMFQTVVSRRTQWSPVYDRGNDTSGRSDELIFGARK
jgi:SAM-dependent methyltransferase